MHRECACGPWYVSTHLICSNADEVPLAKYSAPASEELAQQDSDGDDEDDDEDGTVAGPKVLAHVDLAKTVRK